MSDQSSLPAVGFAPSERAAGRAAKRAYHLQILGAALAVVVLSMLLSVVNGERVALIGLERFPLPHTCMSRTLWGVSCPACGLTRSFILLFHGDLTGSLRMHPLGIWIAALIVFQIPYRLVALRYPGRPLLSARTGEILLYVTLVLLVAVWMWRRLHGI